MALSTLDWIVIAVFLSTILIIGISFRKTSGKSMANFFLGGRNLPWYLAGMSMVATTFAADTPLAVTELVGINGISGNWLWWNFLAGGMLTTFFFANLWRRANIVTEVELIELRYAGKPAAFLRGFKAVYLGVLMNVLVIGWVNLAMMTILEGFFNITPGMALFYTGLMTILVAIYASLSGLLGVVVTDAIQFIIAMAGSIILAFIVVNTDQIGGIAGLKEQLPQGTLNFLPALQESSNSETLTIGAASFLAFFGFVWWASWYPGQEPGGGGYIAQRMMSTKNEKHAVGATLFFQVAHYCLRPWPWILVGLSAIVLFAVPTNIQDKELKQDVDALLANGVKSTTLTMSAEDFENLEKSNALNAHYEDVVAIRSELAKTSLTDENLEQAITYTNDKRYGYVFAMKNHLPKGVLGLLLAAFFAAFMSTISTQLNWGASYVVNDVYKRFMAPDATEKKLVSASRISTILLMALGLIVTTQINSISAVWQFIMECGAGLGMVLILRWYWWRINAWSEIIATLSPFIGYTLANYVLGMEFPYSFFFTVAFTTVSWLLATFLTPPETDEKLAGFYEKIKPDGWWGKFTNRAEGQKSNMLNLTISWLSAVGFTYAFLFLIGKLIFMEWLESLYALIALVVFGYILNVFIKKTKIMS